MDAAATALKSSSGPQEAASTPLGKNQAAQDTTVSTSNSFDALSQLPDSGLPAAAAPAAVPFFHTEAKEDTPVSEKSRILARIKEAPGQQTGKQSALSDYSKKIAGLADQIAEKRRARLHAAQMEQSGRQRDAAWECGEVPRGAVKFWFTSKRAAELLTKAGLDQQEVLPIVDQILTDAKIPPSLVFDTLAQMSESLASFWNHDFVQYIETQIDLDAARLLNSYLNLDRSAFQEHIIASEMIDKYKTIGLKLMELIAARKTANTVALPKASPASTASSPAVPASPPVIPPDTSAPSHFRDNPGRKKRDKFSRPKPVQPRQVGETKRKPDTGNYAAAAAAAPPTVELPFGKAMLREKEDMVKADRKDDVAAKKKQTYTVPLKLFRDNKGDAHLSERHYIASKQYLTDRFAYQYIQRESGQWVRAHISVPYDMPLAQASTVLAKAKARIPEGYEQHAEAPNLLIPPKFVMPPLDKQLFMEFEVFHSNTNTIVIEKIHCSMRQLVDMLSKVDTALVLRQALVVDPKHKKTPTSVLQSQIDPALKKGRDKEAEASDSEETGPSTKDDDRE